MARPSLYTFLGTFLLFTTPVLAATLSDFCADPYTTVCGDQGEAEQAREDKISAAKQRIAEKALRRLNVAEAEKIPAEQLATYYEYVDEELRAELGSANRSAELHFERIRSRLVPAVKRLAPVSKAETDDMLAALAEVTFINAVEIISGNSGDAELSKKLREDCGDDGMVDNAFAFTHKDKRYVVVCPGAAIAALGPEDAALEPSETALVGIIWILGHEVGHNIDSSDHPIMYAKLKGCLERNYLGSLGEVDDAGTRKSVDAAALEEYMPEISADYWGSEQLAAYLESVAQPERKLRILQESLEFLCGTEDDGTHPDGRFRIENFVRRNPRLHRAIGCPMPDETARTQASCTLRGEWRRRFW